MMLPLIAIDGPAGAGKSSTALAAANKLGIPYLDTGALYRAATWAVMNKGISPKNSEGVASYIKSVKFIILNTATESRVFVNGVDTTDYLRSPELTRNVSDVCEITEVRERLFFLQRDWAARGFGVVEGRDIGTVILPDAKLKIFITAKPEIRALRRARDLNIQNDPQAIAKLAQEIAERDKRDMSRPNAPLSQAEDAVLLDTSDLTFQQQLDVIINLAAERFELRSYTLQTPQIAGKQE